jgi:hypothetical protein
MTARRKMHPAPRDRPGLRELDRLMRERVSLAPAPVPTPLHKMAAARQAATGGKRP